MNPKLLDRIAKLLRLARNNSNVNEAASAAAAAQRLMDDNNLSEAMLEQDGTKPEILEDIVDFGARGAPLGELLYQRWHFVLANRLQKLHGCIVYKMNRRLQIIGKPSDVEAVRYLYGYLVSEIRGLVSKHGKGMGTSWRNNYCLGAAEEVARRLGEEHDKWKRDVRQSVSGDSQALVRVDNALAKIERKQADVTSWQRQNVKLRSARSRQINYNGMARELGRVHGATIRIGSAGSLGSGTKQIGGGN